MGVSDEQCKKRSLSFSSSFFPFLFVYHGFYGLLRQVDWISILNLLFIFPKLSL